MRVIRVRIHKKTLQFLYAFCPKTIETCLRAIAQKPKSRMVDVELYDRKCKCIEQVIHESQLFENTSDLVAKDIQHILAH